MLMTVDEMKRTRWLYPIESDHILHYGEQTWKFISDGTETKEDIQYLIQWADFWSEMYGHQVIINYDEMKSEL